MKSTTIDKNELVDLINSFDVAAKLCEFKTNMSNYSNKISLKIGKFALPSIRIMINFKSQSIFYDLDLDFYNEETCIKTFEKLDCKPQNIDFVAHWRSKSDVYRITHSLKLTSKNIQRLNRVFIYALEHLEKYEGS